MTLADALQTLYDSPIATAVRESGNLFAWIESVHVLMATTVLGTIAIVDLRLVGYPAHRRGARRLMLDLLPFSWTAFAMAVVTGSLLFVSNAPAYAGNRPFLAKMVVLSLAGINMAIFHLTAYRRIGDWDEDLPPPRAARLSGAASLSLWVLVVFLGRWIGFTMG